MCALLPAWLRPGEEPGPDYDARLWQFVADVRDGTAAEDDPEAFMHACVLAGLWEGIMAELIMRVKGVSREEAVTAVGALIEDQRLLCGSLAATEHSEGTVAR
jgi:hypothetical protein